MSIPELLIFPDPQALAEASVNLFIRLSARAIQSRGYFCAALSGGSTPRATYTLLASKGYSSQVHWPAVHLFWGDERCVPPNHPDSDFRMAKEALLDDVPIPPGNIHRIQGELDPVLAASSYEKELRAFFGTTLPRIDLIFLGLGEDGHTASLFPGSAAIHEQVSWVMSVEHQQPPPPLVPRVTLTPPVLNAAAAVAFLVTGSAKAERVEQILHRPLQPEVLPAQVVQPTNGDLFWFLDHDAARYLR